jgi:hypothetical protein
MRVSLRSMLAGTAATLAVGVVAPAMAGDGRVHVLTLQLPGGGVERIEYTGDVPPRLVVMPTSRMVAVPMMDVDPFATLNRISAMMDQQAAAMLREVEDLQATCSPDCREGPADIPLYPRCPGTASAREACGLLTTAATRDRRWSPAAQAIAVLIIANKRRPK